ncbi:SMI1/KNR4 family protein [Tenacibaculum tangerinum]|uniref:SMI1/KNR4 family protein n=1 Tax=Tenacibaculum tangerinum TaxID=3038772 RepID=A0ABY8LA32_9FLAO|nr:SMI1/KNR4 family protein [Tenacibaculum tangerinum]WGH77115.1 SMI1/KNR4 family protein [Tenacibaculum tangerinum]
MQKKQNVQAITLDELNTFQISLGKTLPEDYRQHMLLYNGGSVINKKIEHKNYPENPSTGLNYLLPIKYGYDTIEHTINDISEYLPSGYLPIGLNMAGGYVIISLNNDTTYGRIKEWYPDDELNDMSESFTQYLEDMVERID